MSFLSWTMKAGVLLLGASLAGCCVAPVGPYYGPRYGGRMVYEAPPVMVAPAPPPPGYWRWRHR